MAPWKADPWLLWELGTALPLARVGGHPACASDCASTTWVWRGREEEEELEKIPAFPEGQCWLISGKCPQQHREDGLEWDSLGLHESGGITPPMGLAGNWNDGKCLGQEVEFGGL